MWMSYFGPLEDNVDVLFWTVCRNGWKEENVAAYFGVYHRIKLIEDNVNVLQYLNVLKTMWTSYRIYMC